MAAIDSTELKARTILDGFRDAEWSPSRATLAIVFKAMWSASLPVDRINRIGAALCALESCDLQATLTAAVKAKALRSRMISGVCHYEVNF